MATTITELFVTALIIWLAAIITFIIVAIGIDNIYGSEKYDRFATVGGEFLFIKCPMVLFVIFSISCALKFLGV